MHGPPGTGKSQTIANLIADALARDRKVLFVSAKMAALDVVYDRLKELGLERFCLEAHSTKAGKAKIIDELRRTLETETTSDAGRPTDELTSLLRTREALNGYVRALHRCLEPLGRSVYRAIGRLARLRDAPDVRAAPPWTDFSLRSSELNGINPNNRGAVALRNYIEYAERGGDFPAPRPVVTSGETNDFEDEVREALVKSGFRVDPQVGAGRYRIDLAVRDRREPNQYLVGVECDGASYHSSRTARDRDLLRQEVLERMGWRILRVWSTEWFRHREQALSALLRDIERAEQEPRRRNVPAPPAPPNLVPNLVEVNSGPRPLVRRYPPGEPYRKLKTVPKCAREFVLDPSYTSALASIICEIVRAEGPVCGELLVQRIKELCRVKRAGANVMANIRSAIQRATRDAKFEALESGQFLRIRGQTLSRFRVPAEGVRRGVEQIAMEEIALAVLHLVEDQFGVSEEQLAQAVARLFGVKHLYAEATDRIRGVVEALLGRGRLRRSGAQIHLA